MKKRRELKDKPGYKNVFLNDDLTAMLSKLLYECKQMSTVDRVNTTSDGRIQCHMKKASGTTVSDENSLWRLLQWGDLNKRGTA
nr:hypothetical protein BaRGS_008551 [Batillaria attramentaria]